MKKLLQIWMLAGMLLGGLSYLPLRAASYSPNDIEVFSDLLPPGGSLSPSVVADILRVAKDSFGISMGQAQAYYNNGGITITELYSVVVVSEANGGSSCIQTAYRVVFCAGGGSELTVILSDL